MVSGLVAHILTKRYNIWTETSFASAYLVVFFGILYSIENYTWRWYESPEFLFYESYAFVEYMLLLPLYYRVVLLN